MSSQRNPHLFLNTLILGALMAALVYLFHPGVGQFNLLINGHPVADPLFRLAAIPVLLVVLMFIGLLAALAMLGVGMMIFVGAISFALLSLLIVAPYFWPVLLIFCLIILIMASGSERSK